jgi:hypothetical protein
MNLGLLPLVALSAMLTLAPTLHRPSAVTAPLVSDGAITSLGRRPSHEGLYSAEVTRTTPLAVGTGAAWTIHLATRNGRRVAHASITASVWAPDTGERVPRRPAVRYVGGGDYRVDGIAFPHGGWWNIALTINARAGADSLAFNVVLPER